MTGLSPTVWAVLTAAAVVAAVRPRPPVRRLGAVRPDDPPHGPGGRSRPSWTRRPPGAEATALAQWCEGVARSLRSGTSLGVAVDEAALPADGLGVDTSAALRTVIAAVRSGHRPPGAARVSGDVALVSSVLAACIEHGGPAAEPLDRAAAVLRGRAHESAERVTQSAQARWSAQVMTLLPPVMLVMLTTTSSSVRSAIATPPGIVAIVAGATLNVIGWRWQRSIVRRAAA